MLKIHPSGYYAWRVHPESLRAKEDRHTLGRRLMKSYTMLFLFCAHIPLTISSAFAGVPPEYVEPTRAHMKSLGFKFAINKNGSSSSIEWHFPKVVRNKLFALAPHSTNIVVTDRAGKVIARTTNRVSDQSMALYTSYNHEVSDVSVAVSYTCGRSSEKECYGATTFIIPSVSKFIRANPDALNLRPKCQRVTDMVIDCTQYESEEHP
jgi:hypothetical protein